MSVVKHIRTQASAPRSHLTNNFLRWSTSITLHYIMMTALLPLSLENNLWLFSQLRCQYTLTSGHWDSIIWRRICTISTCESGNVVLQQCSTSIPGALWTQEDTCGHLPIFLVHKLRHRTEIPSSKQKTEKWVDIPQIWSNTGSVIGIIRRVHLLSSVEPARSLGSDNLND